MAKLKTEEFIVGETVADVPLRKQSEQRDLAAELFGKDKDEERDKIIDAFEQQIGIKRPDQTRPNLKYKHVLLFPGTDEEDSVLLNQLMNDPELFSIVRTSESWTNRGVYSMFVLYTENLDVKTAREGAKK